MLIRTLAAACGARSMTAAAHTLGVDKATVSRRLAALERSRPGMFERRGGHLSPTAAGSRALEALADIERGESRLRAELSAGSTTSRGIVRLTAPAFLAPALLLPALPDFLTRHPEIDVSLLATSRLVDLARGDADVAIRNLPPTTPGLAARRVSCIALGLYASHRYLARRGPVLPGTLDGHDFVDYDFGTIGGPGLEWLPAAVRRTRVVFRGDDAALVADATRAGLGVAALPRLIADGDRELVRALADQTVAPIYVIVRDEVRRLARVRAVVTWASELLAAATRRLAP